MKIFNLLSKFKVIMVMTMITIALVMLPACTHHKATLRVDEVFTQVDEMPIFSGGDQGILNFIAQNTIYPEDAKKNNITGKVIIKFVVEKDGSVSNVKVVEDVNPLLDAEAIRVISALPKFEKPGKKAGEIVRVNYMIPITFTLK